MENIKHKEMTVPGVGFYSAEGVDKPFPEIHPAVDEHKNRVVSVGIDLRATKTSPLPQHLCVWISHLLSILLIPVCQHFFFFSSLCIGFEEPWGRDGFWGTWCSSAPHED